MRRRLLEGILLILLLATGQVIWVKPAKAEYITDFQQGEIYDISLSVASRGYYTIDLSSHFGADADLYLYDANNVLVAKALNGGSDTLQGYLDAGYYKIRIKMSMCLADSCRARVIVRREGRKVTLW